MKICKLHNFKRQCTARLDDESTGFLSTNGKVYILNNISYEILLMLEGGNSQEDLKRLKTLDDQTIQASNPERFSLWDWCLYLCIKAQVKGILVL